MSTTIAEIIEYIRFGRSTLLEAIQGLSLRELTQAPVYEDWTVKDILAHIIGWDRRVLNILPLIVQNQANLIPGVEVQEHNRQSVAQWRAHSFAEVLLEFQTTRQQVIDFIVQLDYPQIDLRHERHGRIITIRSYVIQIMVEHELQHGVELEQWRKRREQMIDGPAIRLRLETERAHFMNLLDRFTRDDEVSDKRAAGEWSISDIVGHVADWEQRMLKAMHHIHDPSLPIVPAVSDEALDWNGILAARRANKSWAENYHYLRETQIETDNFVAALKPGDWRLRGPYPWPNDQGTLAELVEQIADHYQEHLPDLEGWLKEKGYEPQA
jgi:uncharacterized damage-inducible protein DinB